MPALVPGLKTVLECEEGQEVVITTEYICATDVDSDDSKLTYLIARQPYHGVVLKNNIVVDRFFQEDIDAMIISYKHTGTEATFFRCVLYKRIIMKTFTKTLVSF